MKAQDITITAENLMKGIAFYGETNADNKTLAKLDELHDLMYDILDELLELDDVTMRRNEASAKSINKKVDNIFEGLVSYVYGDLAYSNMMEFLDGWVTK